MNRGTAANRSNKLSWSKSPAPARPARAAHRDTSKGAAARTAHGKVRTALVNRVKDEIARGAYDSNDKIEALLRSERLARDLSD
jgi:hypothetical protein